MIISEKTKEKIMSAQDVYRIISTILDTQTEIDREREQFYAIGLDAKNRIKYIELVSLGILTSSLIHPRETFRMAVLKGAASLIVCHNHPSGDPAPSRDDIAITERLKNSGEILGIRLLDHVIIGDGRHASMADAGLIKWEG